MFSPHLCRKLDKNIFFLNLKQFTAIIGTYRHNVLFLADSSQYAPKNKQTKKHLIKIVFKVIYKIETVLKILRL